MASVVAAVNCVSCTHCVSIICTVRKYKKLQTSERSVLRAECPSADIGLASNRALTLHVALLAPGHSWMCDYSVAAFLALRARHDSCVYVQYRPCKCASRRASGKGVSGHNPLPR